jgi:hypothetical protein
MWTSGSANSARSEWAWKVRKQFFFEKKNQKTFANLARSLVQALVSDSGRQSQKFFGAFFQKRTPFLSRPPPAHPVFLVLPPPAAYAAPSVWRALDVLAEPLHDFDKYFRPTPLRHA